MLHYEVCWLDGVSGEHLTPNLRRGNAYVVVTSANMHVVAMRGVVPAVSTVPLDEIDEVNNIGAVKDGFFYSYVWGEPKAMAVAKRFDVVRRQPVRPLPDDADDASGDRVPVPAPAPAPAPGPVTEARITTDAPTARPTTSVFSRVASMMRRSEEPARTATTTTTTTTTTAATAPSVVSFAEWRDARDRAGPVVESFAPQEDPTTRIPIDDGPEPGPEAFAAPSEAIEAPSAAILAPAGASAFAGASFASEPAEAPAGAFNVRAAVAFANKRTVDRIQRQMEIEAEKEDARPPGSGASRAIPAEERGAAFARETISFVSIERGSQVLYHLERAVVTLQARRAVANAAKTSGVDPAEAAATKVVACLAGYLPEEALEPDEVVDAANLGDPGVDVSPLEVAADVARLVECTDRDALGRCTFAVAPGVDAAETLPAPAREDDARGDSERGDVSSLDGDGSAAAIRAPSASSSERSSNPAAERLREGMLLATPLVPALRVARASTEAARVIRWARRNGSDVARDGAYAREIFGALEVGMLAPRFMAEVGNTIVVERVGILDDEDLCAAAAMAQHAKHSSAIRKLALGSPKLFDKTAGRLSRAAFEATYPHPSLRRRRRFPDDEYDAVANWARLINALRQGAAAHRAAQLFSWCRRVMAESEGAAFERFDLARRERPLELIVNAAFIFNPLQHAALAMEHEEASEDDYADEDVDFTRLRRPRGAPSDGVLDLVVDVLHEAILLARHAHLLGGGDGWNPKHLVAHIVSKMVPPRDVRPKVSAMFARMMNIVLTAPEGRVAGAEAVRAYRCAAVLRHLMEGMPDAVVAKCVQDEYEVEMKYVFSRKEVYERTTRGGDAFFERHARPHFDFVAREVLPDFGKAGRAMDRAEAMELWREHVMAQAERRVDAEGVGGTETPPLLGEGVRSPSQREGEAT